MKMMVDFILHFQIITKYLEPIEFKGALSSDKVTHSLWNQIDHVFINQPIIFSKC